MSRTNLASDASQSGNKDREIFSRSDEGNAEDLLGVAGLSLQDKGWISPPDSVYSSSSESVIISDEASLPDSHTAPAEMMARLSYGSNSREGTDYLNSVSSSGTDFQEISLNCGQSESKYTEYNNSDASSVKSPTNEPSEHLKAAASPKNESITVIDTSKSLNEEDFEGKDETSSSNQVKIEDENREARLPNTDAGSRIARGKNHIIPFVTILGAHVFFCSFG